MSTGELTLVAEMDLYFVGLACDLEGQLYGAATRGDFCSINKQNGDVTIINNTGYNHVKYAQSMAFDHNTGRLL
mgnify:FL=1